MANYNRKDAFYSKAKEEGQRSRAVYKLDELNKRFQLFRSGIRVVDLGCWPGSWSEYAAKKIGSQGRLVGIDLVDTEPLKSTNATLICGDARDEENLQRLRELLGGRADLLLSDMSPKLTGIKEADQAGTVACAELALYCAQRLLKEGGNFVAKLFKGNESEQFVKSSRELFNSASRVELKSTRKSSNEFYFVGVGFRSTEND